MLFLVTLLALTAFAQDSEKKAMSPEQVEKEKLAFIERGIVEVMRHATIPELYGATIQKAMKCKCQYGPVNILWGSRVGMTCKMDQEVDTDAEPECGVQCLSPRGETVLLMCPEGWTNDCATGCVPPENFTSVRERTDFLEKMLDDIVMYGYDYLIVNSDYIKDCACTEGRLTKIHFGSNIGLECVFNEEQLNETECGGYGGCKNEAEQGVMIFCPSGHTPSCNGCSKTLEEDTSLDERIMWLVNGTTSVVQETEEAFVEMIPSGEYAVECGCAAKMKHIEYGSRVGYWCQIEDVNKIGDNCGANVLCENANKELILHMCPAGFVPDCSEGCGYAWKQEL